MLESGILVNFLRREMAPKDLCLYPDEVIVTDGSREFAEYTTLRSWVRQWLNYVKWYYMVAVSPGVTIQDLLDAPFVNRKWQVESTDSQLVRFGLVWKVFDLVALRLRWPVKPMS